MKSFQKKLSVVERATMEQTKAAMDKVIDRYVQKMSAKGWKRDKDAIEFAGHNFMRWEHIITMTKS